MMSEKTKKLAAIDLLIKNPALKPALSQDSAKSRSPISNLRNGVPVEIDPNACRPWKLADRPLIEAQHKDELVQSFQEGGTGQIQPIVVRKVEDPNDPNIDYEVICGRVRWLAARELGISVQAVVRELSDQEAYAVMSAENRQRRNLSDFAKAKSYQKALSLGVFDSAQQLADAEGIAKSKLSLYLGFAELPDVVAESFTDITKIPYRLGYEIHKACQTLGIEEVLQLVPSIESGELSRTDVQNLRVHRVTAIPARDSAVLPNAGADLSVIPNAIYPALSQSSEPGGGDGLDFQPALTPTEVPNEAVMVPLPSDSTEAKPKEPKAAAPMAAIFHINPQTRNIYVSSSGQKLFTYNNASRGWLIRITPEVSPSINEDFMRELGRLIESYFNQHK